MTGAGGRKPAWWTSPWAVFAAALLARIVAAAALGTLLGYVDDGRFDDGAYLQMANSFLGRDPTLVITHPPLYSLWLAPFLALPVLGVTLARFSQLALAAAIAPLTMRLSRSLRLSRESAAAAGWIVAAHPVLIYFAGRLMTETPFAFLTLAFFVVWLAAWEKDDLKLAAASGLLGGLASLTRGTFMPMGGALLLAAWALRRRRPRWFTHITVCGAVWALSVAPWTARNWVRLHRFVPISVQGGWSLYEGMTTDPAEIARRPVEMGHESEEKGLKTTIEIDAYFGAKAKTWIHEHPGAFARLCARKALIFWRPAPYPPYSRPVRWVVGAFETVLYLLALLGLIKLSMKSARVEPSLAPEWLFLAAWAVLLTLVHAVFASTLRYRMPLEPILAVLAGGYLNRVTDPTFK